jgi:hypothetical protein
MRMLNITLSLIVAFIPYISAVTTFFDNPDDFFVMGNLEQGKDGLQADDSGGNSKKEGNLSQISEENDEKIIKKDAEEKKTPKKNSFNWNYVLFPAIVILICASLLIILKYRRNQNNLEEIIVR